MGHRLPNREKRGEREMSSVMQRVREVKKRGKRWWCGEVVMESRRAIASRGRGERGGK